MDKFFYLQLHTIKPGIQPGFIFFQDCILECEYQWQHYCHHYTYGYLQRKSYTNIIYEGVTSCLHHKCIGWCREGRGKAHARTKRYGKHKRLTPICCAATRAIGAISTAVAVLLINIVISDVVK